jgi:hypothetical protein
MSLIPQGDERSSRRRKGVGTGVVALVGGAVILLALLFMLLLLMAPRSLAAQGLSDFDYEDLSFRGVMLDVGYIFPTKVERVPTFGGRVDLGFLGPGVRAVAGFNRWSSRLTREEVQRLENRLSELVSRETGTEVTVPLGEITWSDVALYGDAHLLWRVPFGMLTYAGVGGSAHVLRGSGDAIEDTFVEDLLNSIRAGVNVHTGLEIPVRSRLRLVGEARYELLENLSYLQIRAGGQWTFGPLAPGER